MDYGFTSPPPPPPNPLDTLLAQIDAIYALLDDVLETVKRLKAAPPARMGNVAPPPGLLYNNCYHFHAPAHGLRGMVPLPNTIIATDSFAGWSPPPGWSTPVLWPL
jgi:hypothetical protein